METTLFIFALISSMICLTLVNAVEYAQVVAMGINCPTLISCESIGRSNFTRRNCECDRKCVNYRDCCVDARTASTSRNTNSPNYACVPFGDMSNMGAYVIETCSRNYNGPAELQRRCLDRNNVSDPIMSVPVTDTNSKTSYRNRYCAECNDVDTSIAQSWLLEMVCSFTSNINTDSDFIYRNIYYNSNSNEWKIDVDGRSYPCKLKYNVPSYLMNKVRLCRSNVISSCPSSYTRRKDIRDCESYTAIVYDKNSAAVYKNPHCAKCNGLTVDAMECTRGDLAGKKKPFSFSLLMDWNRSDGDVVGVSTQAGACGENQKYDPYFKKCRNLVCALPGYERVNGKCRKPQS